MQKFRLTWREWMLFAFPVVFLIIPLLANVNLARRWAAYNPFIAQREKNRSASCQTNLKQVGLGFMQYVRDYDEKFPPATGGRAFVVTPTRVAGWSAVLQPYLKATSIFACPSDANYIGSNPLAKGFTSYYYNANLSTQRHSQVVTTAHTILLAEGNDGLDRSDARYSKNALPKAWLTDEYSPAWRHLDGANYSFTDGHVKWVKPNDVTTFGGRKNTFALK